MIKPLKRYKSNILNRVKSSQYKLMLRNTRIIKRHGKVYAIAKGDAISRSLFIKGAYGRKPQKLAIQILKVTGFEFYYLINIGANIGTTIVQLVESGYQHGVAIEPHPGAYKLLKTNLELNRLLNYKVYNNALGAHTGITL